MKRICANLSNHVWCYATSFSKEVLLQDGYGCHHVADVHTFCLMIHSATQLVYSGNKDAR